MKAKKPKEPEYLKEDPEVAAAKASPNPANLYADTVKREQDVEKRRQGYAAALLTGPRGLADRKAAAPSTAGTRALMGA